MAENIEILDSMDNKVSGILSVPEGASSVVVMSHGLTSSKNSELYKQFQSELNDGRIGTLRYDYYGHGPAYGFSGTGHGVKDDITLSKAVESLRAMVRHIREREDYKIGLLGASFGGLISLVFASQDQNIKALALKSPVTEPIEFWRERIRKKFGKDGLNQWEANGTMHYKDRVEDYDLKYGFWEDLQGYDTLRDARNISCPTLIVHGDSDTYVPISQSFALARVLGKDVKIVKGADHDYSEPGQYSEMKKLIKDFIFECLK